MRKAFFRQFLLTSTLLLLSFLVLGSAFGLLVNNFLSEENADTLRSNANTLAQYTSLDYVYGGMIVANSRLCDFIDVFASISGNTITLTNEQGTLLYSSHPEELRGTRVGDAMIGSVLLSGEYNGMGTLGGLFSREHYNIGISVTAGSGQIVGAVFVSAPTERMRGVIGNFIQIFFIVASVVLFLSWIWAYVAAHHMSRPLKKMAEAAREFALGKFDRRIEGEQRIDEIGELAASFNNMAASLERTEALRRDFIANVSHELKTPMTTIGGYIGGMLDGTIPPDKQEKYMQIVASETKRLSRLVSQMLEISRIDAADAPNRKPFDLCELTRRVLLGMESKINEKSIDIEVGFDDPVEVLADPDAITQVVYNLTDNAIKYADSETIIEIDIQIRAGKAVFSVANTGRVIPPEELPLIFDRFHKVDHSRKSEGLGLGLHIVKSIINKHGETVGMTSDGGRTVASFTLALKR